MLEQISSDFGNGNGRLRIEDSVDSETEDKGDGPEEPGEMGLRRDPLRFGARGPIGAPVELRRETEGEGEGERRRWTTANCPGCVPAADVVIDMDFAGFQALGT